MNWSFFFQGSKIILNVEFREKQIKVHQIKRKYLFREDKLDLQFSRLDYTHDHLCKLLTMPYSYPLTAIDYNYFGHGTQQN